MACLRLIPPEEIKQITSQELYQHYEQILEISISIQNPDSRWCPRPTCGSLIVVQPSQLRVNCESCGCEFCAKCRREHTIEQKCKRVSISKEEKKNSNWLKKHTKPCPSCKQNIEKVGGCYNMRCPYCKITFCWECGQQLTGQVHCAVRRVRNLLIAIAVFPFAVVLVIGLAIPVGLPVYGIVYSKKKYIKKKQQNSSSSNQSQPQKDLIPFKDRSIFHKALSIFGSRLLTEIEILYARDEISRN